MTILYHFVAFVCGIVGVPMLIASIKASIRNSYIHPGDYSFDLSPLGIIVGALLTLASILMFTR